MGILFWRVDHADSPEYREEAGPGTTHIEVNIHSGSDPEVFDLLATLPQSIQKPGVEFSVLRIE